MWNRHPLHGRLEGADKDKAVDALLQPGNDHDFCEVALNSPQQAGIVHAPVLGVLALHIRESIIVLQYLWSQQPPCNNLGPSHNVPSMLLQSAQDSVQPDLYQVNLSDRQSTASASVYREIALEKGVEAPDIL